jgi:alpha-D-ribose 1-methylphosphonate 5-triphosphate synthase subunit PhnL
MLLTVQNYAKHFLIHHLGREVAVFEGLNFTLDAGQFALISGPNGVGKSTLLRCLYRSYRPTHGSAIYQSAFGAVDLARLADVDVLVLRRTEIGFVTQFLRPRPRVTALELVAEPLLEAGHAPEAARAEAESLLAGFGLKPGLLHAYPTTFSGGEQQKVNLARALIRPCRLLLLDEPTASLDAATRAMLVERLTALKAAGVAMLGVFHHPEDVAALIDLEVHLTAGAELATLPGEEVPHVAE